MAGELNTEVRDNPGQCRAWADFARKTAPGAKHIGDVSYRERGDSESIWQGTAADAARTTLTQQGQDSDKAEQVFTRIEHGLTTFANEIDTVRSRMAQARQVATDGQLIVTPDAILPPGPGPGAAPTRPDGPMSPDNESRFNAQCQQHQAAASAHQARQAAFREASSTIDDARRIQEEAHQALDKSMDDPLATAKSMKSYGMFVVSGAISQAKARETVSKDLLKKAGDVEEHGNRMQAIADDPTTSPQARSAAARSARAADEGASATRAQGERIGVKAPGWVKTGVEANPGNLIEADKGLAGLGKGAARGVPLLGTGVSLVSGGIDVAMGKPVGQAAAETGANIGGGAVGGMAGAEVGAAIGTFFCPVAGSAVGGVIGGVVGGIIGGMSATKGVDQAMGVDG